MSFSAQRPSLSHLSSARRQAFSLQRKARARRAFRRSFVEQLESRQLLAVIGDTGGGIIIDDVPGNPPVPGKISETDPRVESWTTAEFKSDSLIVRFADFVTRDMAESTIAAEAPGATIRDWDEDLRMAFLDLPADSDEIELGHQFLRLSNTVYAEPNFIRAPRRFPNDPGMNSPGRNLQWSLHNTGLPHATDTFPVFPAVPVFGTPDADIDAPEAWDLTVGSPDVVIAVLDTGINYFEPDLQANLWENPRELPDGIDNDQNGYIDDIFGADPAEGDGDPYEGDPAGHGTSIFGVIAAPGDDGLGITGVSWNSKVMSVKVSDDGGTSITVTGAIGGYRYVQRMKSVFGINIVAANISFGSSQFSFAEFDVIQGITNANVLVVAAVANAGVNHDIVTDYPSGYNLDPIIAVTSSSDTDFILSNLTIPVVGYGRNTVDLLAPGLNILTYTMPFTVATQPGFFFVNDAYTGTSYAAAHVTGVAALINSLAPGLSATDVKSYILQGADRRAQFRFLTKTEARLNAFGALQAVPENTISGSVFQDANNNRIFDPISETGLAGWQVYLDVNNNSTFDPGEPGALSAADGSYTFDAYVVPGTYRVREVLQPGYNQTTPTTNGGAHIVNLTNRDIDVAGLNFGNRQQPGNVTGSKFLDLNGDGIRDPGEPGLAGIMFYVDVNDNRRINVGEPAAITDVNGNFTIPNVQPGTYQIREVLAPGFIPTLPNTVAGGLPDPVLSVVVVSNTTNSPPLVFGNRAARDWGDLPESLAGVTDAYNTLAASGGPSHGILPGFMLGTVQDFEDDGIPSPSALGDDGNPTGALDDEDGLESITLVQGQQGLMNLRVTNSGRASGYVQAWIDFNTDGDFADAGEQILRNFQPADGLNANVPFSIPNGVMPGVTYARIRYSYQRNLGPDGAAQAGEVEDYQFTIFSSAPIARPDRFPEQLFPNPDPAFPNDPLIKQNSSNNELDVLRNDPAPATGTLSIVLDDLTTENGGTLALGTNAAGDQVILYTPRNDPAFIGTDRFTYRVTDGTELSEPAEVLVRVTATDPHAVDDTYTVPPNVATTLAPPDVTAPGVTGNDVFSVPVTIASFTQPDYDGDGVPDGTTVTQVGNDLRITPPAGFVGTVQFTYTITDTDPTTADSTAEVTVQVTGNPNTPPPSANYQAIFTVQIVDARGNVQGSPGFRIDHREVFYVEVYSEDIRPGGSDANRGVEAAFIDLLYDRLKVAVNITDTDNDGDVEPDIIYVSRTTPGADENYDFDQNAIVNSPEGIVNEVGGVHNRPELPPPAPPNTLEPPLGKGRKFVVSIGFDANMPGTVVFTPDPAEDATGRSDVLLAPDDPLLPDPVLVEDRFVFLVPSNPVMINATGAPEFINLTSNLDVNADTRITAFDALAVINELNSVGSRQLSDYALGSAGELPPTAYVDVNGDGSVSAFDALAVINYLNLNPLSSGSAPEFIAPASAPESAAEFIAAESDAESENKSNSSPIFFTTAASNSAASNSTATGAEEETVAGPTSGANNAELLYLTAVDELMTVTGDEEDGANSTSASEDSLARFLTRGSRLHDLLHELITAKLR